MKSTSFVRASTAVLLAVALGGCVIVTDRNDWEDDWDDGDQTSWQQEQQRNKDLIADLSLGQSIESVREQLGKPEFTEAFVRNGQEYLILRYRTHHRHSDGETTEDETTPLVFENGALMGWGDSVLSSLL